MACRQNGAEPVPLTATGELSPETSACIREGRGAMGLRRMMGPTGGYAASVDVQTAEMASFMTITVCLNDKEWQAAAAMLELRTRDWAGTDCLLAELEIATGVAEDLLRADVSGCPGRSWTGRRSAARVSPNSPGYAYGFRLRRCQWRQLDGGHGSTARHAAPVAVDDPRAFLPGLSPREQSCLDGKGIGPRELSQMTGRFPGRSPESAADIVNCLQDNTVLRVFLPSLVGQVEPFSRETSLCIREGFVPIDMRRLLAPAVAEGAPANSLALSMVALNVSVVCMNDAEWATYVPRLGMEPEDRSAAACLFEELGGPAKLVEAMQEAGRGEMPEGLSHAWKACGLEDNGPPS